MTFISWVKIVINYIILNILFDALSMGHGILYNLGVGISVVFGLGIRLIMDYSNGSLTKKKAIVHSILSVTLSYFSYFLYEAKFTWCPIQIYLGVVSFMAFYLVKIGEKIFIVGLPVYLNVMWDALLAKKDKGGVK